ncbi:PREDICTED: uncharacterized protein LOC109211747 [Nicotiana attenuata]|uniref:uncharacterized protein LOC109211747 n=1 Tax=Nicotiana attenuata TaxID=49451 RepID=UPI00090590B7|nr:PREDICTED: uncharacterized protein LOC109211747 [Nicotiana attenuata]
MGNIEEMLKKLMDENQNHATTILNLERQMGQLASAQNNRPVGALPSDTEPIPKAQGNAVILRNGRVLEEVPNKKKYTANLEGKLGLKPVGENEKESERSKLVIVTRPPPPFPQRLQKQKDDAKYKKFLDILSQVRVNLPLVEILQNARVQCKLPPKLKDPGSFTIPLSLGKQEVEIIFQTQSDNINFMSSSLFKKQGLGVLRPTTITLQLVDRSLVVPEGIIEYVLVQVGKFILPADFIILDYEE